MVTNLRRELAITETSQIPGIYDLAHEVFLSTDCTDHSKLFVCCEMDVFSKFVCLLLGMLLSQSKSLRMPLKVGNCQSAPVRFNRNGFGLRGNMKLSSSTISNTEFAGPLSPDFVRYLSFVQIFQAHIDAMYSDSMKIKCPFFRRRATDSVDGMASVVRFILARHKSLPIPMLPGSQQISISSTPKLYGLSVSAISNVIAKDWKCRSSFSSLTAGKGYYITGKLTREIYRDDCFFDGPDPDMPVLGVKKYVSSTSQLFDHKASRADLISISSSEDDRTITVHWRLEGILNLPWHPVLKPWTGQTTYYLDDSGLIERHIELWDISVLDAFVSTLFPFLNFGAPPATPVTH